MYFDRAELQSRSRNCARLERLDPIRLHKFSNYQCYLCGNVICLAPLGGTFIPTVIAANSTTEPAPITGYSLMLVAPPANGTIAKGTTLNCGSWYVVTDGDDCASITMRAGITTALFLLVNPSLSTATNCSAALLNKTAYCVGPTYEWNITSTTIAAPTSSVASATAMPTSTRYTHLGC